MTITMQTTPRVQSATASANEARGDDFVVSTPEAIREDGTLFYPRSLETTTVNPAKPIDPVRRLPSGSLPLRNVEVMQQWEGVVESVNDDEFAAVLHDLTDFSNREEEFAEFSLTEVSQCDRELVAEGAVFYWCVGYMKSPAGQVTRISEIRFRRRPPWSGRALKKLKESAGDGSRW